MSCIHVVCLSEDQTSPLLESAVVEPLVRLASRLGAFSGVRGVRPLPFCAVPMWLDLLRLSFTQIWLLTIVRWRGWEGEDTLPSRKLIGKEPHLIGCCWREIHRQSGSTLNFVQGNAGPQDDLKSTCHRSTCCILITESAAIAYLIMAKRCKT